MKNNQSKSSPLGWYTNMLRQGKLLLPKRHLLSMETDSSYDNSFLTSRLWSLPKENFSSFIKGHRFIKGDQDGKAGPVFCKPALCGSDPLVLLNMPNEIALTMICSMTLSGTDAGLTGLYFPGSSFPPLLWMGVSSRQMTPLQPGLLLSDAKGLSEHICQHHQDSRVDPILHHRLVQV